MQTSDALPRDDRPPQPADVALVNRAVAASWDVPQHIRDQIVEQFGPALVALEAPKERDRFRHTRRLRRLVKLMLKMEARNMLTEGHAMSSFPYLRRRRLELRRAAAERPPPPVLFRVPKLLTALVVAPSGTMALQTAVQIAGRVFTGPFGAQSRAIVVAMVLAGVLTLIGFIASFCGSTATLKFFGVLVNIASAFFLTMMARHG